jgi:hypothetical protein
LIILAVAVAALALYTFVWRGHPSRTAVTDIGDIGGRLHAAVAAKATGAGNAPAKTGEQPVPPADSAAAAVGGAVTPIAPGQPETWGGDPFVRDWIMVNELANLSLKAITLGGERAYALINNQILEEGDQISGKRIVKIESDKVTLEQGGRTFTLLLGE